MIWAHLSNFGKTTKKICTFLILWTDQWVMIFWFLSLFSCGQAGNPWLPTSSGRVHAETQLQWLLPRAQVMRRWDFYQISLPFPIFSSYFCISLSTSQFAGYLFPYHPLSYPLVPIPTSSSLCLSTSLCVFFLNGWVNVMVSQPGRSWIWIGLWEHAWILIMFVCEAMILSTSLKVL